MRREGGHYIIPHSHCVIFKYQLYLNYFFTKMFNYSSRFVRWPRHMRSIAAASRTPSFCWRSSETTRSSTTSSASRRLREDNPALPASSRNPSNTSRTWCLTFRRSRHSLHSAIGTGRVWAGLLKVWWTCIVLLWKLLIPVSWGILVWVSISVFHINKTCTYSMFD